MAFLFLYSFNVCNVDFSISSLHRFMIIVFFTIFPHKTNILYSLSNGPVQTMVGFDRYWFFYSTVLVFRFLINIAVFIMISLPFQCHCYFDSWLCRGPYLSSFNCSSQMNHPVPLSFYHHCVVVSPHRRHHCIIVS